MTEIFDSRMVPKGLHNECRVSISGYAAFEIFNVSSINESEFWNITVGSINGERITGLTLTKVMFTKQMLESLTKEQEYQSIWQTEIKLPRNATLLNKLQLNGLNWTVDFGGGTRLCALVTVNESTTIVVTEELIVTERNVTASEEILSDALSNYKTFQIEYMLPQSNSENPRSKDFNEINTNWSYPYEIGWVTLPPISKTFHSDLCSLRVTATPSFLLNGFIGWQFIIGWPPPFIHLNWFETWMKLCTSVKLEIQVSASLTFTKIWEAALWEVRYPYFFYIGVPVWVDLIFTINAAMTIDAYAEMSIEAETAINGSFKGGVRWEAGQWFPIIEKEIVAETPDYKASAAAGFMIRPSLQFRFAFLFYSLAGPFLGFEPYAETTAQYPEQTWTMTLGFKINTGITFAGWLKQLLKLDDISRNWNWTLKSWNGTWGDPPTAFPEIRNLALINIEPTVTPNYVGAIVNLNVSLTNNGDFIESISVGVYHGTFCIDSYTDIQILQGQHLILPFKWDTSGLEGGDYILTGEIAPTENETNLEDNSKNITIHLVESSDVALSEIALSANETYVGRTVNVTVTLQNIGNFTREVEVILYCDRSVTTCISKELAANEEVTFMFPWNTNDLEEGENYVIWANVTTPHYDTNITNNVLVFGIMKIKLLGDINGDSKVDIRDLSKAALCFGGFPNHSRWDVNADVNDDYEIDIYDLVIIASNFGKSI